MSEILANLVVFVVIGSLIGLLFLFLHVRKRKNRALLLDFARKKGWQMQIIAEPLVSGMRMSGNQAKGGWTMESVARSSGADAGPGSSNVSQSTTWWADSAGKSNACIVLGPGSSSQVNTSFSARSNPVRDSALRMLLGESASWVSTLEAVDAAVLGLGDRFLLLTDCPEEIGTFFKPGVVEVVNKLPHRLQPVIIFRNCKLEMRLNNVQLKEPAELESFIELGCALVENWRQ